jgi:tRNA(Ile)-lysidine synthetase-like protein
LFVSAQTDEEQVTAPGGVPSNADERAIARTRAYRAVRSARLSDAGLACSGGVDSSALTALAGLARRRGEAGRVVVLHVDHRTRPESAAEAEHVRAMSEYFGLPFEALAVADAPPAAGASPEAALREARYDALAEAVERLRLRSIVTAHTRDDQIETILLRLFAGTGGLGAAGMRSSIALQTRHGTVEVLRPLLTISRDELLWVLRQMDIEPLHDPTNHDVRYRRNLLRHRVIPEVRSGFPGFDLALERSVEISARDAEVVDSIANDVFDRASRRTVNEIEVDRNAVRLSHPAIAARLVRSAAGCLLGDDLRELSFERAEAVRLAAGRRSGAVIELPHDVVARVERDVIRFFRRSERSDGGGADAGRV